MGCVASKLEEEEEVVIICRERKRQLKLAVERRFALAESHCRYCQALYGVAAAIKLFVARHSSPSSPFLITFPSPHHRHHQHEEDHHEQTTKTPSSSSSSIDIAPQQQPHNLITNPMFLQQTPTQSKTHHHHESTTTCECFNDDDDSSTTSSSSSCEEVIKQRKTGEVKQSSVTNHVYFSNYMQTMTSSSGGVESAGGDFGWDFFNPFDGFAVRPEGYRVRSYEMEDDELRVVREEEGIPDLEDENEEELKVKGKSKHDSLGVGGEDRKKVKEKSNNSCVVKVVSDNNDDDDSEEEEEEDYEEEEQLQQQVKGLAVIDSPEIGRELLEALKDIQDHFVRAYDSGKDVSRMLEANRVHLQSSIEEIKENSTKLIQAVTWHRSTSSAKPSSCRSLVATTSKGSSQWTEFKNDLFDDYGGMDSGSHSLTLGRLYAWEKKLYEEVKAGDSLRKIYDKKCARLKSHDVKGDDEMSMHKTRAAVKDLYAQILVAIRSAESISRRIQKLRDEELQPQIIELLKGLTHTWKVMMETHETQNKILCEVKTFACPTFGKFCNDSHRLATLQLEAELHNWRVCFLEFVAAQKAYVNALHGWLTKFLVPEVEFYSKGRSSGAPCVASGPPLLVICHEWLASMEKLPSKSIAVALKSFTKDVRALWAQQGEEQQQKRKVDSLAKELDRRTLAFQKSETRFLESKLIEYRPEADLDDRNDHLTEKKDQLDMYRRKLEVEKEKHHNCVQETQRITLNGFQTGFSPVFESLADFSKASLVMYSNLVNYYESLEKAGNQSYIEGSPAEDNGDR